MIHIKEQGARRDPEGLPYRYSLRLSGTRTFLANLPALRMDTNLIIRAAASKVNGAGEYHL
jgi:hypothetical protein